MRDASGPRATRDLECGYPRLSTAGRVQEMFWNKHGRGTAFPFAAALPSRGRGKVNTPCCNVTSPATRMWLSSMENSDSRQWTGERSEQTEQIWMLIGQEPASGHRLLQVCLGARVLDMPSDDYCPAKSKEQK